MSVAFQMMCDMERRAGNTLIFPGDVSWLGRGEWPQDIVVSEAPFKRIRIVAIYAKHPGCGSFSRLITNLCKADLLPVVVSPLGYVMPQIMFNWGWLSLIGMEEYMPTRKWIEERKRREP